MVVPLGRSVWKAAGRPGGEGSGVGFGDGDGFGDAGDADNHAYFMRCTTIAVRPWQNPRHG